MFRELLDGPGAVMRGVIRRPNFKISCDEAFADPIPSGEISV
jgi:hypothetical protein